MSQGLERTGKVQSVLGLVDPEALGVTMPHEHLFVDVTCMFDPPTEASDRVRAYAPFSLEHLGWIRLHYFRHYDNLLLGDEETTIAELERYKTAGGSTIVEVIDPRDRPRPGRARASGARDGGDDRDVDGLLRRADASGRGRGNERGRRRGADDRGDSRRRRALPGDGQRPGLGAGADTDGRPRGDHQVRGQLPAAPGGAEGAPRRGDRPARDRLVDHRALRPARALGARDPRHAARGRRRPHPDVGGSPRPARREDRDAAPDRRDRLLHGVRPLRARVVLLSAHAPRHAERRAAARRRRRPRGARARAADPDQPGHLHPASPRALRRARLRLRRRSTSPCACASAAGAMADVESILVGNPARLLTFAAES